MRTLLTVALAVLATACADAGAGMYEIGSTGLACQPGESRICSRYRNGTTGLPCMAWKRCPANTEPRKS